MTTLIDRIMKSIISLDTSSDQDDKIRQILEAELTAVKDSQPKEVEMFMAVDDIGLPKDHGICRCGCYAKQTADYCYHCGVHFKWIA